MSAPTDPSKTVTNLDPSPRKRPETRSAPDAPVKVSVCPVDTEPLNLHRMELERVTGNGLIAVTILATIVALRHGGAWWIAPFAAITANGVRNRAFFRCVAHAAGWSSAILCIPVILVHQVQCLFARTTGAVRAEHFRDRWLWPMVILTGAALLGVQISGGAFEAEFTAHPDEPAHFVSGLMLYDYLVTLPRENPIGWAQQYYLHYPKVALGHWPPLYPAMEASWWLLWGPSRLTAMLLQWLIGVVALTMFYRLARSLLSLPVTAVLMALMIAAPVFQRSLEQTMADLLCLLWAILVMHATVRLLEEHDQNALFLIVTGLVAAALTKGTAICLIPVPFVAVLAYGKRIRISGRVLVAGSACLLAAAAWYFAMGDVQRWGGMRFDGPWPGRLVGRVAGWGFVALAIFGLRRRPLAVVSGSVVVCMLVVSFFVRAMLEERLWITALPALLILSGLAASRFKRPWIAAGVLLAAMVFFPFARYRQSGSGFDKLVHQLQRPSRMVVTSLSPMDIGEGGWIAMSALAEKRPASFVIRASKVLADADWNGNRYKLLTSSEDAVLQRLDELGIDTVIAHVSAQQKTLPHQVLLRRAVMESRAWAPCGSATNTLSAYCRTEAPRFPRQPLRVNVQGWMFEERTAP